MKGILVVAVLVGCGGSSGSDPPLLPSNLNTPAQVTAAEPAVHALADGHFADARTQATTILAADPHSSRAAAVRAIAAYQSSVSLFVTTEAAILDHSDSVADFDSEASRKGWADLLTSFDAIDRDLAVAGADPGFSLDLCIACWTYDWNGHGGIDDGDRQLFEIEADGHGGTLDETDPRRRPTFHFDVGDVDWARAMIAFQRAGIELVLAYHWGDLNKLFKGDEQAVTLKLQDRGRVRRARELILQGLAFADRCRTEYLAETDDDREWVPNPRQQSHPIPFAMDANIYATWEGVIGDVRGLIRGDTGISFKAVADLVEPGAGMLVPDAYLDVAALLDDPTDVVIDFANRAKTQADIEKLLRGMLGNGYRANMKPTPLLPRLARMRDQLNTGEETFEQKLRYLLWLN